MPRRTCVALGGLLLLSLILRLYHLDYRALWWDEGLSLFFSRLGYFENARFAVLLADTNPPIYRLLLGAWTGLVGSSAWATRLFSALLGVLLVALTYRLASDIAAMWRTEPRNLDRESRSGTRTAAAPGLGGTARLAALLAAISPMLIYYAQEAKGYSLVATSAIAAMVLWLRLHRTLDRQPAGASWRHWIAWGGCVLLALGSHYIVAFLLLLLNLWSLWLLRGATPRTAIAHLARQCGIQLGVAAVLMPFMAVTYGGTKAAVQGASGEFSGLHGPAMFFGRHAVEFALGPQGAWGPGLVLASLLFALGALGAWSGRLRGLILGSWIVVPLAMGFALNLYHEFFFPRFLLYAVPVLLVLAAAGLSALARSWRFAGWAGVGVITLLSASTLDSYYSRAGDPAEDWRPLAAALRPLTNASDQAIYVWGWIPGYLHAYLPPAAEPGYHLGYFTPETIDAELTALTAGQDRLWLLDYKVGPFDLPNAAGRWLGQRGALAYAEWFGNAHVSLFVLPQGVANSAPGSAVTASFENGLQLTYRPFEVERQPGDALAVELTWAAAEPPDERLTVYLHVISPEGRWVSGRDSEPLNGLSPFTDWVAQTSLTEWRATVLPPDLPSGTYAVRIGLYNAATGTRVRLTDGSEGVTIGRTLVKNPAASDAALPGK